MFLMPNVSLNIVGFIFFCLFLIIVGLVIGFFITRKLFKTQLKKNPPVNEKMIRAMFQQMGRTPSEKQVRAVMRSVEENK